MGQLQTGVSEDQRAQKGGAEVTEAVFRLRGKRRAKAIAIAFVVATAAALVVALILGLKGHRVPLFLVVGGCLAICFFGFLAFMSGKGKLVVSDQGVAARDGLLRSEVAWSDVTSFEFSEEGVIVLRRNSGKPLRIPLEFYEDPVKLYEKFVAVFGSPKPVKKIDLLSVSESWKGLVISLLCSVPLIVFSSPTAWAAGVGTGAVCAALGLRKTPTTLKGIRRRRMMLVALLPAIIGLIVGLVVHREGASALSAVLLGWSFIVGSGVGQLGLYWIVALRRRSSSTDRLRPGPHNDPRRGLGL